MVGLCGGFTTFSSFSLQTLDLLRSGATVRAAVNIVASIALGVGAVALGHLIAEHFNGHDTRIAQSPSRKRARAMPLIREIIIEREV